MEDFEEDKLVFIWAFIPKLYQINIYYKMNVYLVLFEVYGVILSIRRRSS